METKVTLIKAQKRLTNITNEVAAAEQNLDFLIQSKNGKIDDVLHRQQMAFADKQNRVIVRVQEAIIAKKRDISMLVNTNLNNNIQDVDNMMEESGMIDKIYSVLTDEQIQAYEPFNNYCISSDDELNDKIEQLTTLSSKLSKQINYTPLFRMIQKINISNSEKDSDGKKYLTYIFILFITVLMMVFASSILILIYFILGIYSFIQAHKIAKVLNLYDAVMQYCENDIMKEKKESVNDYISKSTDSFFTDVEEEYISIIKEKKFKKNDKEIAQLSDSIKSEIENAKMNLLCLRKELAECKKEVARIESELEAQEQDKLKKLDQIKNFYLDYTKVNWEKKLLENIYLGQNKKNEALLLPVTKDNTLYLAEKSDDLFELARLFILQMLMHVNPDYLVQIALDYKYMGGNLQPFLALPNRSLSIFMENDKINEKIESMQEDIFSRNSNILKSVASIEDFNNLMSTYNATGESYVFVHIFGLQSITDVMSHFLRNGPKVGYYFNLYMTMEEYKSLNSEDILDSIQNYYLLHNVQNLGVFPEKRLKMVVASYLEK